MLTAEEWSAIQLSLLVAGCSTLVCTIPGIFCGWVLARKQFFGKSIINAIIHLPLVLPPVAVGYLLLLLLGRRGLLGQWLDVLGWHLAFSWQGAVLASAVMSFPLMVRAIRLAIELVNPLLEAAGRNLGASPRQVFLTVTLPLAWPGILTGMILAFARSVGEFGATITFAGNIAGVTRTLPLAMFTYSQVPGGDAQAIRLMILSMLISFAALIASEWLAQREPTHERRVMLELDVQYRRQNFCLDVQCRIEHAVTGVFGPSASGKTTLLHVIAGLEKPAAGRIVCDGRVLFDHDRGIDEQPYRRRVAVVFQEGRLFPHYSVDGNLRYGQRWLRRVEQRVSFNQVVDLLELGALLNRRVQMLSGGEQRRVAIGRALLSSPSLLLLDEPLTSLDIGLKSQVLPFLRRIKESLRIPMLYVSHDIGEILQLTEQLLALEDGHVLGLGPFHEVITDPAVIELARRLGLENVLPVEVLENVQEMGLSRLRITADLAEPAVFWGPLQSANVQTKRYVAIRPEDIALADQPVTGVSIQNQICGQVRHVTTVANRAIVEVDLGAPLLAEVSLKSVKELGISPGRKIYCLWKAHAVRYL